MINGFQITTMLAALIVGFPLSGASVQAESQTAQIGSTIKTSKLEIQITSVKTLSRVGGEMLESKASDGGVYLAVQWNYKNISDVPISTFNQPSLHLKDPKGTKYDPDIDASSSYASELNVDEKILSDLNPGIRVKGAEVFEVSKELFATPGWKLFIDADQEIAIPIP